MNIVNYIGFVKLIRKKCMNHLTTHPLHAYYFSKSEVDLKNLMILYVIIPLKTDM